LHCLLSQLLLSAISISRTETKARDEAPSFNILLVVYAWRECMCRAASPSYRTKGPYNASRVSFPAHFRHSRGYAKNLQPPRVVHLFLNSLIYVSSLGYVSQLTNIRTEHPLITLFFNELRISFFFDSKLLNCLAGVFSFLKIIFVNKNFTFTRETS